jgi:hypothetical protein
MVFLPEAGAAAMGMEPWVNPFPAAAECHWLVRYSHFMELAGALSSPVAAPLLAALRVGSSVIPILRSGLFGTVEADW